MIDKSDSMTRYLDSSGPILSKSDSGHLVLKLDGGEEFTGVEVYRAFPLSHAERYLAFREKDGNEIGILRNLDSADDETKNLIRTELDIRYFTPRINRIISIKPTHFYSTFHVETDAGECRFTVQVGKNRILKISDESLLIFDVDGNRFELLDYTKLPVKYINTIEMMI